MLRRRPRRTRALVLAGLAAIAVAGCGSSQADYGASVAQVQDRYRDAISREVAAGAALYATDPNGAQTRLAHAAADAHRLAAELAALPAPTGKKTTAVKLVKAYRSLAASLDALAGATRPADASSLQAVLAELQRAQVDERTAVTAISG